jgi:hypothetical protein
MAHDITPAAEAVTIRTIGVSPWLIVTCPNGTVNTGFASVGEATAFADRVLLDPRHRCAGEAHRIDVEVAR